MLSNPHVLFYVIITITQWECFCSLCSDEAPGCKIICPRLPRKKRGSRHLNLLTWQALLGVF